jgi:hypothetical protein
MIRVRDHRSFHGFALVEICLAVLAVSIVAAVVVMALIPPGGSRAQECRLQARLFGAAVTRYHDQHDQAWPPDGGPQVEPTVHRVAVTLIQDGQLRGNRDPISHLHGSQRRPIELSKGWTYDFERHVVTDDGCGL